jgi:hypothetical protein
MTSFEIILLIISTILLLFLCASVYYNVKFGIMILSLQESIEESLDILDERYSSISKILEIPVFFDSIEVRNVLADIEKSRDAILYVANNMSLETEEIEDDI